MSSNLNSYHSVEGNDTTWVKGTSTHLLEVFEEYKTSNDFFHTNVRWLVYFLVGIPISIFIWPGTNWEGSMSWILPGVWVAIYPMYFNLVLGWLLPRNETEQSKQLRYRKAIWSAISTIILGVIGTAIWYFLIGK